MKPVFSHPWHISPGQALALQDELRQRVSGQPPTTPIQTVAGADVAFSRQEAIAFAAVVLFDFPSLERLETVYAHSPLNFPYVPGLLSFREGEVLLKAFARLSRAADVVLFDGQGIAHPRRLGIASHLGILLDVPTIGCAKSRLIGTYEEPPRHKGTWTPLRDGEETVGVVLRTRTNVKPMFISPGHRMNIERARDIVMTCAVKYRLPEPTRQADYLVGQYKKKSLAGL